MIDAPILIVEAKDGGWFKPLVESKERIFHTDPFAWLLLLGRLNGA